jgi:ABC-type uncharacterized transport system substrate-binding protein
MFCPRGLVSLATVLLLAPVTGRAELIVQSGRGQWTLQVVDALVKEGRARGFEPHIIELSGNSSNDFSRVSRAADGTTIFAVGPHATMLASTVAGQKKGHVVALGVPNPELVKGNATFVSFYPPLASVLRFLEARFSARRIALLYSPAQNSGVAAAFVAAAKARGLALDSIPAASAGDLVRGLKPALARADVLLIPVDPLLFDRESARIVVDEAGSAGKPVVGFLPDVPQLGMAGGIVLAPAALAKAAWESGALADGKVVEVNGAMQYVTQEATTTIDLDTEKPGEKRKK